MSGYTKGPWILDGVEIRSSDSHPMDRICDMAPGFREDDAKLIAAAPDLLEALQKIQFRCECFLEDDRDMKKHSIEAIKAICDDAIDKALVQ